MIAHISGIVVDKSATSLVVDVAGVGYEIQATLSDIEKVPKSEKVVFYTHHHIREQSQELFGFLDKSALSLFRQLISVKNVGPKVALAILEIGPSEAVKVSIAGGDVKFLQTAKGVGKRAAEQIIVELRDKVGFTASNMAEDLVGRSGVNQADEALQALVALGYSEIDAQRSLKNVDTTLSIEERIKQALRG